MERRPVHGTSRAWHVPSLQCMEQHMIQNLKTGIPADGASDEMQPRGTPHPHPHPDTRGIQLPLRDAVGIGVTPMNTLMTVHLSSPKRAV